MESGPLLGSPQGEAGCQEHQEHLLQAAQVLAAGLVQTQLHLKEAVQLPGPGPDVVFPEDRALCLIRLQVATQL